jgi:predicted transcriptional regulator
MLFLKPELFMALRDYIVYTRLDEKTFFELVEISQKIDRSKSYTVYLAIKEFLSRHRGHLKRRKKTTIL